MIKNAAQAAGYDTLFYPGSKNGGGYTVFRDWSYFTENKQYAERYMQRDNDKSLYTAYVKLDNPFDTRNPEHRKLFDEIRQEYGLGEIQDTGLPDWTDGYDIADYIDENGHNFDSIILDEGGDLVDGNPVSRGLSYVIRKSAQIKSADPITYDDNGDVIPISQRFDRNNDDIRYSLYADDTKPTGTNIYGNDVAVGQDMSRYTEGERKLFAIVDAIRNGTDPMAAIEAVTAEQPVDIRTVKERNDAKRQRFDNLVV